MWGVIALLVGVFLFLLITKLIISNEAKKREKDRKLKEEQAYSKEEVARIAQQIESEISERKEKEKLLDTNIQINEESEPFYTKIVGVTKGKRQEYLEECYEGQELIIKWDDTNKYSEHALAVYAEISGRKKRLGFIPDETASILFDKCYIDEDTELDACIIEITGGTEDRPTIGCNIEIFI